MERSTVSRLVGVINTAHSPFCYLEPEKWDAVRARRKPYRDDVPYEKATTQIEKADRIMRGFSALRAKVAELRPDVLVIFGNDQEELYSFTNFPAIGVFVGEEFKGTTSSAGPRSMATEAPTDFQITQGHPALATWILSGLLNKGFDPAFMMKMPNDNPGMCHAIMRPIESLTDGTIPVVPVMLNVYYAPQLTANRCLEIGRAVGTLINEYEEELRVVVIGSGGLWHTPLEQGAYLDEDFDRKGLAFLEAGDIQAWANLFDSYVADPNDPSQEIGGPRAGVTGLPTPGGPQGAIRETCNWIAASAVCEGRPSTIVDYIPVYSSPIGVAYAYCTAF